MTDIRPRRSVLAMPGSNPRVLEKARGLPTDVVMIDLEDGVAPEMKGGGTGRRRRHRGLPALWPARGRGADQQPRHPMG